LADYYDSEHEVDTNSKDEFILLVSIILKLMSTVYFIKYNELLAN